MGTSTQEAGSAQSYRETAERHLYCAEQLQRVAVELDDVPAETAGALARQAARQILIDLAAAEMEIAQRMLHAARGQA